MNKKEQLIDKLNGIFPVSLKFRIALRSMLTRKWHSNLTVLIKQGSITDKAWQLQSGYIIVRQCFQDGTFIVKRIYYRGDIFTDLSSFFFDTIAMCEFVTVGYVDTLELQRKDYRKLDFPETAELAQRIMVAEKDQAMKRADLLAIPDHFERVKSFLQAQPAIGLPNEYAASFLAMTEEVYAECKYKLIEQAPEFAEEKKELPQTSEDLAYRCKQLLKERFKSKDIGTIPQIASECNSTVRTLNRAMEKTFGFTAHQLLTEFRMEHAMELLKNKVSVQQVAISVGYADQATFSKLFKKHFNLCPKDVKKQSDH